jgi:hypothetical protein
MTARELRLPARNLPAAIQLLADITYRRSQIASDMPTFVTNSAAHVAKHVAQRPDHEFLFFSLLLQFTSCGGDLGSPRLNNVVR